MSDGEEAFARMLATVRALPTLPERAAPDIAVAIKAEIERTIAAGTAPDGTPWAPRKKDGGAPLRKASSALYAGAIGRVIYVRVLGTEARHHIGTARGGVRRQIIPTSVTLTPAIKTAIGDTLKRHFHELVAGESHE